MLTKIVNITIFGKLLRSCSLKAIYYCKVFFFGQFQSSNQQTFDVFHLYAEKLHAFTKAYILHDFPLFVPFLL